MPTVYATAYVPAADRAAAETAIADHLSNPNAPGVYTFSVPLTEYPGDPAAPPTHYGVCASMTTDSDLYAALAGLQAAFPGSGYQVVQPTAPYWKAFKAPVHWIAWLNNNGLQPRVGP